MWAMIPILRVFFKLKSLAMYFSPSSITVNKYYPYGDALSTRRNILVVFATVAQGQFNYLTNDNEQMLCWLQPSYERLHVS